MWREASDFTEGMVTFVENGLAAGEPVMVALIQEHADWVRDGLGAQSSQVKFVDMAELGRNPARIIPAWQQFLASASGLGRPARGIGEPIWSGRRAEELAECQLHEALLNVALDPKTPFWLVCPYDSKRLDPSVIEEAHRSHPAILDAQVYRGSTSYGGRAHVDSLFSADLLPLPGEPVASCFTSKNIQDVFAFVIRGAHAADLWSNRALSIAAAARQLAADSLRRGADGGVVRIWNEPHAFICEVADTTTVDDVLAGRHSSSPGRDQGLWLANQSCDLVQLRSTASGTTIRLYSWN